MALKSTLPLFTLLLLLFLYLLCSPSDGLAAFRAFLRTEFSEENLEFWLACEEYKKIKSQSKMASKAKKIFAEYIAIQSCKEVSDGVNNSYDHKEKRALKQPPAKNKNMHFPPLLTCFIFLCR